MGPELYYRKFEARIPYKSTTISLSQILLFRFFSLVFIGIGLSYLSWRWTSSLNPDALWFSIPLVTAETFMFVGSLLLIINHWNVKTISKKPAVKLLSEIDSAPEQDRPVRIDLFITSYNEEYELVEDTIKDALNTRYPFGEVDIKIYLCDDGRRDGRDALKENFKELAAKYSITYLNRTDNKGYKAGNLNNAFWQSDGDLIVILDADTRIFPDFLVNLTGYFRDEKMAWVQSPQWFYDIPDGKRLKDVLKKIKLGNKIVSALPFTDKFYFGKNLYGTDPQIFYDVILRHRNAANAAFCCGAGSMHRRKALEELIINQYNRLVELKSTLPFDVSNVKNKKLLSAIKENNMIAGPFVHHVSEDIYTSVLLHADKNKWKSYQHPDVECKMLSPQSVSAYTKQFSRYAEGTFDLFFSKDNPLIKKGLNLKQRIAYGETLYSYFSPFWISIFLISPIIFYFTLVPPIMAFNFDFFIRFIALNIAVQIVSTLGNWGISTKRAEQYYIGGFWIKIKSFFKVLIGKSLLFNTTIKSQVKANKNEDIKMILPHLIITALTIIGLLYNIYLIIENVHPSYSAFFANTIWAFYNIYQLNPMIRTALAK